MISWFEKHNKISLIITLLIAIFIFYISSLTFVADTPGPEFKFKPIAYHFLIFLLFSFFLLITILKGEKMNLLLLTIIISIIYAISDEFHQLFVPGRNFAISDILIDSAGVLFAGLLYSLKIKFKKKIKKQESYSLYY